MQYLSKSEQNPFSKPFGVSWRLLWASRSTKRTKIKVREWVWERSWASFWRALAVQKLLKRGLGEVLDAPRLKTWFLKDVFNEITTFGGSLDPQNLPETTSNACFECWVFKLWLCQCRSTSEKRKIVKLAKHLIFSVFLAHTMDFGAIWGPLWRLSWRAIAMFKPSNWLLDLDLEPRFLRKRFFEDVLNKITTFAPPKHA